MYNPNKLKVFGFQRAQMNYNYYNPLKIKCLREKKNGYFEAPKYSKSRELNYLVDQYKQRLEYEKYFNPRGLKPTITSVFPKVADTIEFVNLKCFLVRTNKEYHGNYIKFLVDKNMSKPEIRQYIQKLYKLNTLNIKTAILPGRTQMISQGKKNKPTYIRRPDRKKALVKLDFYFPNSFSKIQKK